MLRNLGNSIKRFWNEDPAGLIQRVLNGAYFLGLAALVIVISANVITQTGGFLA